MKKTLIQRLTPVNLHQEKEKFLADQTYNPQFKYEETVTNRILTKYGQPRRRYLDLAQTILDQIYAHHSETELFAGRGQLVDKQTVDAKVGEFLKMHQLDKRYQVVWSSSFISRTSITNTHIKLRLPPKFRQQELVSMLYHEIGTHALRRVNYEQQPWFKKKKQYGFGEYLPTEEGLATLHSLLAFDNKSLFQSAIRYVAVDYALHHSFVELWSLLTRYVDDIDRRWMIAVKQKRGLTDTAQPGGFTKDLVYFEGAIKVWEYLQAHNFNITQLYYGKVDLKDVDKAVKMNPNFKPLLPSFFVTNRAQYISELTEIGEVNFLT